MTREWSGIDLNDEVWRHEWQRDSKANARNGNSSKSEQIRTLLYKTTLIGAWSWWNRWGNGLSELNWGTGIVFMILLKFLKECDLINWNLLVSPYRTSSHCFVCIYNHYFHISTFLSIISLLFSSRSAISHLLPHHVPHFTWSVSHPIGPLRYPLIYTSPLLPTLLRLIITIAPLSIFRTFDE